MKPTRIEALADGIFAIVMTLLVLELHVPTHQADLIPELIALLPKLLSLIISFVILSVYWSSHHILFSYIKKSTFNFMWLNIIFLLFISLIPFSAALLGAYPFNPLAQVIYGIHLICCGLLVYSGWSYARRHDLVEQERISDELVRNARHKILLPPFLYSLGILTALFDVHLSLLFFILGPLIYFVPVDSSLWQFLVNKHWVKD